MASCTSCGRSLTAARYPPSEAAAPSVGAYITMTFKASLAKGTSAWKRNQYIGAQGPGHGVSMRFDATGLVLYDGTEVSSVPGGTVGGASGYRPGTTTGEVSRVEKRTRSCSLHAGLATSSPRDNAAILRVASDRGLW